MKYNWWADSPLTVDHRCLTRRRGYYVFFYKVEKAVKERKIAHKAQN